MKRSWGFLIVRQYNYKFENFYAVVIQRAYRNYKKRPESLAKRIWEVVRNDGTPDRWKYLGIIHPDEGYYYINRKLIKYIWKNYHFNAPYGDCTIYWARTWAEEKRVQLIYRLAIVTHILVKKLLYQQGYMIVRDAYWSNQLKWLQNPEYYRIDKDNIKYL